MKLAVFGATGLVGGMMIKVLEERGINVTEFIPIASERSLGKEVVFNGKAYKVVLPETGLGLNPDVAIFSAGGGTSLEWAPKFAEIGCRVIDNSSAWRMDITKKLVIPEVNGDVLTKEDYIIANPNCSTIQLLLVLAPLHKVYGIKRVVVSTYQSVTGTGKKAVDQMFSERRGEKPDMVYPYAIDLNILPHIDSFQDNGYTKEELKMTNETKKILDEKIELTATTVRVPTIGGHSESVNIEFHKDFDVKELQELLAKSEGVILEDSPKQNIYPMPLTAHNKDEVFVGRIRRDFSQEKTVNLWVVADNLRKGAATNAVQILEVLMKKGLV